ncbi:MAG: LPS-assembly protein LptD [Paludibacteraceae bacterium]|nr:LPS-assembly protein LptD [Paludibacteraceae bacterium]
MRVGRDIIQMLLTAVLTMAAGAVYAQVADSAGVAMRSEAESIASGEKSGADSAGVAMRSEAESIASGEKSGADSAGVAMRSEAESIASGEKSGAEAPKKGQKISAPIHYTAKDSVIIMGDGTAFLHGSGELQYEKMELNAEYIRADMDSSQLFARGVYDSISDETRGKPVFKDGKDSYESNEITYNLHTQKGFIRHVVTEQGEGYIIADRTKKVGEKTMMMAGGQYTTCDQHEHPHFYLKLTKAKVEPGNYIAAGPAYMVVGDVPLPLAIPFGFFPFTDKYSSGLIMPTFGDDYTRGLYLRGIGYYFALSDYADLEITGDIYTKGTWAVYAKSRYVKRYSFSGNISMNYRSDVVGERDMPDYSKSTNFSIQWTHTQDSKANPYSNFSASVNFSTSGYNRSNINSYYNAQLNSENTKSSSISYTQRFPESPWSLTMTAMINQRTKDSTLSLTLPDLTVSMSSIYPFKRKKPVGKERWYEKIKMSYSGNAKIAVTNIREDKILKSNFLRDWQTGLQHSIPISASFTAFKYLNITPSITLRDRMYFQRIDQRWDDTTQKLARDTTNGFFNVFDFNTSISMSTKLYGFYIPSRKLFPNGVIDRFRHVLTPNLSFSYHPDFGNKWWGYYNDYEQPVYTGEIDEQGRQVQKIDELGNPVFIAQNYSRFQNGIYGNAQRGAAASLNFGLANNLEVKVVNKKDTTGKEPYKIISLIDNLSITGGYNFIADSMNWSNFQVNLRIKFPKPLNYTLNLSGAFDPYMYELNPLGTPVRTNKQYWSNGRFPHFLGTGASLSYTFNNQTFKKWFGKKDKATDKPSQESENEEVMTEADALTVNEDGSLNNAKRKAKKPAENAGDDGYVKTQIPWSLSISYSIRYQPGSEFDYKRMYYKMIFVHNLSLSGSLGLGQGWKVSATTSFDFKAKRFSYTNFNVSRDLHCWNMTASFVPFGPYKSYTFHIGVNASMLADLKYDKNSAEVTQKATNWW